MENDRKTQIIKTAVKRFARHGFGKTTLTEIARDLRIGKATIYHYFSSKEDLFHQTMEYDATLFIEDVKQIFNNEQLTYKERFVEYFNYKHELFNKYKLLYDLMVRVLKEEGLEKENDILKKLLHNEEEVLKNLLNNVKVNSINPDLPKFLAIQSWGILFGKKLNDIRNDGGIQNSKDLFMESLNYIIK